MKKKMIAAGAASAVLAAMPVVGVFAIGSVTDYVELTVTGSCTMEATPISDGQTGAGTLGFINLGSIAAGGETSSDGTTGIASGTPMTISCNTANGITLTANATSLADGSKPAFAFGSYPSTDTSKWSAKISVTGDDAANVTIASGWNNWNSENSSTGTILSSVADRSVYGITVTPSYRAKAANNQPAGTYTGSITYTFAETGAQQQGD